MCLEFEVATTCWKSCQTLPLFQTFSRQSSVELHDFPNVRFSLSDDAAGMREHNRNTLSLVSHRTIGYLASHFCRANRDRKPWRKDNRLSVIRDLSNRAWTNHRLALFVLIKVSTVAFLPSRDYRAETHRFDGDHRSIGVTALCIHATRSHSRVTSRTLFFTNCIQKGVFSQDTPGKKRATPS